MAPVSNSIHEIASHAHHAVEHALISLGGKVGATGTVTAVGSGAVGKLTAEVASNPQSAEIAMTISEFGVVAGVVLGVAGFAVQTYFSWRRDRRESAFHAREDARKQQLAAAELEALKDESR